ncbi:hypothetical protein SOPP22_19385 [Shewanella sp. OPT22]|nr:hypothetical protein SOPP22_19385 [Shewanella sp. OPT22]
MAVTVYFRFLNLNRLQMLTLESEVSPVFRKQTQDNQYVAYVLLDDVWLIDDISTFAVQQQISDDDCDILLTPQNNQSFEVNTADKIVNQMLKHIDCSISISTKLINFED